MLWDSRERRTAKRLCVINVKFCRDLNLTVLWTFTIIIRSSLAEFSNIIIVTLVSQVLPSSFFRRPFSRVSSLSWIRGLYQLVLVTSGPSELSVVEKFRYYKDEFCRFICISYNPYITFEQVPNALLAQLTSAKREWIQTGSNTSS